VIGCLEGHPLFKVFDAYSANATKPNAKTRAVSIWQDLKGTALAYVGNRALGADDVTGSGSANVNQQSGALHYGFTQRATALDHTAITTCVRTSGPVPSVTRHATRTVGNSYVGARRCARGVTAGPHTSCPFAEAVVGAYRLSRSPTVQARSSVTGLTYKMHCVGTAGTLTCVGGQGAKVSFPTAGPQSDIGCPTGTYQRGLACYAPGGKDPSIVTPAQPTNCPPGTQASQGGCATPCQINGTCAEYQTSSSPPASAPAGVESAGSYTHAADAQFCTAHSCIPNFPNGSGYIVQCADTEWSHSGGLSGACSDHGGVL
jgi:hypothetical protein